MTASDTAPQSSVPTQAAAEMAAIIAKLKAAIFDALAATHIAEVCVEYDTDGDDDALQAHPFSCTDENGQAVTCPEITLAGPVLLAHNQPPKPNTTLADAIFALVYLLLDQEPCAWIGEDGSFGTFRFLVAARTIELSHTRRYLNYETAPRSF